MNTEEKFYHEAINFLYGKNGVGNTYGKKRKFWQTMYPGMIITHCKTDRDWVKAYQFYWFTEAFPERIYDC